MGQLLTAAVGVAALAAKHATTADRDRRVPAEVAEAVVEAGFARHFVPASRGGDAGSFTELTRAVAAVGEGCTATAWIAALLAAAARMTAHLPDEGQAEVWSDGADTVVVAALVPFGKAEPVEGGWRLSGEWPYISGVDFADWALVCGNVLTDGKPAPHYFAVPRAEHKVVDTWFTLGMRGTGSNTLVLEDVVVPASRVTARDSVIDGRGSSSPAPCHNVPLRAVNGLPFCAPALGAARAMLSGWTASTGQKIRNGATAGRPVDKSALSLTLAEAAGEIEVVELLLSRAAEIADRADVTSGETARSARDYALAIRHLRSAVDRLFAAGGTSVQTESSPLARIWRDVHAIASHMVIQLEPAALAYAEEVLR
ncbi:acyl-CoA dehydrogenase family protein [Kutzneria buriramensis]|uniref:Two-component flavin-dependent monooxygenase n=1 Tax=Kutzneria buriramensis TaxID=1045776 RepID=A0A3E0GWN3_9PSEU|nr:acyl-CoA dehydrogenase family protein [Kutzneria buriramensis]REH32545.1 two-component flavin-dependent monooxygenase [Kutzneria buriramensis]